MPLVDLLGPLPDFDSVGQATPLHSSKLSPVLVSFSSTQALYGAHYTN